MRTAALAIACFLGAASTTAAAGDTPPAINLPPFPSSPPPAASPPSSPDLRAYAPLRQHPEVRADVPHPPRGRVCFNQSETREKIAQHRLTDPVSAIRAGTAEGEALRTRLCRWKQDELVYEVSVLRRDGRVVRLYINAQNGRSVSPADLADPK